METKENKRGEGGRVPMNRKRERIYVCVPFQESDPIGAMETADAARGMLSRQGWEPVSPFDVHCGKNPDWRDRMCFGLRAMADCAAVWLCEDWFRDVRCRVEYKAALELGLRVVPKLRGWMGAEAMPADLPQLGTHTESKTPEFGGIRIATE